MNRPKRSKDYSEIREKVQRAAIMIAEGSSEKHAAWVVDLPRASLQRYMSANRLPDGLPIWPEETTEQCHLPTENGAADAAQEDAQRNTDLPLFCPEPQSAESGAVGYPESDNRLVCRDALGRYLPGSSGNPQGSRLSSNAREAKRLFVEACPKVAQKMIDVFFALPSHRPDLVLAFGKEILDRGLGKAVQAVEVREESISIEYQYVQSVIAQGDEATIRELQRLASRMEEYARGNGGACEPGEVATLPPPGGTLGNLDLSRIRTVSQAPHQHATPARKE